MKTTLEASEIPLQARVERLERSARRWRWLASGCGALLGWLVLTAQSGEPRILEARGLVVRDDAGVARAQVTLGEEGPAFSLYDEQGYLRAALAVEAGGPMLNLYAGDGEPRLVAGERDQAAFFVLRDAAGAPRAAMAVQSDGSPSLYLLDERLNPIWRQPEVSGAR